MTPRSLQHSLWTLGALLLAASLQAQAPAADDPPPTEPTAAPTAADTSPAETTTPSLPAQIEVALDRQEITVGGRVKATITLVWMGAAPSAPARFPTWQETWGRAEVLESSEVKAFVDQSGRHIFSQELQLTAFKVGEVRLPSIEVALPLAEYTVDLGTEGATTFEVVSILPPEPEAPAAAPGVPGTGTGAGPGAGLPGTPLDGAAAEPPELRPAAALKDLPPQPLFLWTTGLLALACVLATVAVDRRLRYIPEEAQAPVPVLPPYDEFVQRLTELDPADAEPTHTALSLGLRRYLGRRLGFQAAESTTSEIQRRLRDTPVSATGAQPLVQLFRACDQVKFARQQVAPEVTRERLRTARQLAQDIEERLRPRPEELAEEGDPGASVQGRAA